MDTELIKQLATDVNNVASAAFQEGKEHKEKKKDKIGMYGETPRITIGKFIICEMTLPPGNQVWIEEIDEDGMAFGKNLFEAALKKFYDKNF